VIKIIYYLNSNIRYLRKKYNYSLQDLATKLDLKLSTLKNLENGQSGTSLQVVILLRDIFKISIDNLIFKDLSKERS